MSNPQVFTELPSRKGRREGGLQRSWGSLAEWRVLGANLGGLRFGRVGHAIADKELSCRCPEDWGEALRKTVNFILRRWGPGVWGFSRGGPYLAFISAGCSVGAPVYGMGAKVGAL